MSTRPGFEALPERLRAHGAGVVFGLPGTQNIHLFEGLHRAGLRIVVPTNEFAAGMMANGWARTAGRTGVLAAIPGPGFALALGALAEASDDSIPMVLLTGTPPDAPGRRFQLQRLDQAAIARGVARAVLRAATRAELGMRVDEAFAAATAGQPGPVLLELADAALRGEGGDESVATPTAPDIAADAEMAISQRLRAARRPVLLAGNGALGAAAELRHVAEALRAPVVTTPSARGVVPEDSPLAMGFEPMRTHVRHLEALAAEADLVLALGARLSHNATAGFSLRLPPEALVHVDAGAEVLGANYPASLAVRGDVPALLRRLLAAGLPAATWSVHDLARWRARLRTADGGMAILEPALPGGAGGWPDVFAAVQAALGPQGIVVTDSGMHQFLARRHLEIRAPRGLLIPSDFQSMGFGIPAAIGAAIAAPGRPVLAVMGDGGFAMSAMELGVAVREGLRLVVLVIRDGEYGLIRAQQVAAFGRSTATGLDALDYGAICAGLGVRHELMGEDVAGPLGRAVAHPGVTVLELPVGDSLAFRRRQAVAWAREGAHRLLGRHAKGLRGLLRRWRGR